MLKNFAPGTFANVSAALRVAADRPIRVSRLSSASTSLRTSASLMAKPMSKLPLTSRDAVSGGTNRTSATASPLPRKPIDHGSASVMTAKDGQSMTSTATTTTANQAKPATGKKSKQQVSPTSRTQQNEFEIENGDCLAMRLAT
jgi:hypothetical protein